MNVIGKTSRWMLLSAIAAAFAAVSCTGVIFDEEGDCEVSCQVKFKYDMNMKFADAFSNSVPYVTAYIYDAQTGALVSQKTESGPALKRHDYVMEFEGLPLGTYDIIAWCGDGLRDGNFFVPSATPGTSGMQELTCTMDREEDAYVKKDVGQLYHGIKRVTYDQAYGVKTDTLSLVKNTNTVRVVLQHLSGIDVDPDLFRFEITDENGFMAHDNTILEDEVLTYSPWSVTAGSAGIGDDATKAQTSVSVAVAEFTVGRLVTENSPILSIYNCKTSEKVLSIPLKDYALLVKGNYNKNMSDQEYLDRQDEYNLTFFLDEFGDWASSHVIINSWHVVLQNSDLM